MAYILGENLLIFDGNIFFLLKVLKYFLAGFFLVVLVPIGMLYARNEALHAIGQVEAGNSAADLETNVSSQADKEREQ